VTIRARIPRGMALGIGAREGYCYQHVQTIMLAIDQYAESALGNREYFLNKPHALAGRTTISLVRRKRPLRIFSPQQLTTRAPQRRGRNSPPTRRSSCVWGVLRERPYDDAGVSHLQSRRLTVVTNSPASRQVFYRAGISAERLAASMPRYTIECTAIAITSAQMITISTFELRAYIL
jgi:hypothetical protein